MSDSRETPESPDLRRVLESATYRLAHLDTEFLQREELRPVRFQLELLKPELLLQEHHVESTIVLLGGTRILERGQAEDQLTRAELSVEEAATPENRAAVARWRRVLAKSRFYDEARQFSRIVSEYGQENGERNFVI
ncbi:MAG: 3-isopropylmalate dehydrogenase, partial [Planctomycetes bacterium]|nr:3-isopropylmalate dehydrogenase [Planctomycetota bacterium]